MSTDHAGGTLLGRGVEPRLHLQEGAGAPSITDLVIDPGAAHSEHGPESRSRLRSDIVRLQTPR